MDRSIRHAAAAGWRLAARHALIAFVVALGAAEIIVVLLAVSAHGPTPSPAEVAGAGGALFYAFHRVDLVFEVPRSLFPASAASLLPPVTILALALAPLTATALIAWALMRGGMAVAGRCGGGSVARALHGAKVAVPYAVLSFALSFAVRVRLDTGGSARLGLHPDPAAALLWPAVIAALAGAAGGVRAGTKAGSTADRRLRGVLAGGWRMVWVGLALCFLGLLVVAATKPDDTRAFLAAAFSGGAVRGIVLIGLTALVIPNMAAWILFPALGACTGVSGAVASCLLSYGRFPGGGVVIPGPPFPSGPVGLTAPPRGYFLFVLVPVAAVVLGGMAAAARGRASNRLEGAALGAGAGVLFGALSLLVIVLARASMSVAEGGTAFFGSGTLAGGPQLPSSAFLALAWGVAGGAVGGSLISAGRLASRQGATEGDHAQETELGPDSGDPPHDQGERERAVDQDSSDHDGAR